MQQSSASILSFDGPTTVVVGMARHEVAVADPVDQLLQCANALLEAVDDGSFHVDHVEALRCALAAAA